jgi:hypothetical protein
MEPSSTTRYGVDVERATTRGVDDQSVAVVETVAYRLFSNCSSLEMASLV